MGVISTIRHDRFPAQSGWVGQEVAVAFDYDLDHQLRGRIVRDDREAPWRTLIKIDEDAPGPLAGLTLDHTECQYRTGTPGSPLRFLG